MRYFHNKNALSGISGFDDFQIEKGHADDLVELTIEELDKLFHPEKYYTDEEKRKLMPPLTKLQFNLCLYDRKVYDQVMGLLNNNLRLKIEFDSVPEIERLGGIAREIALELNWSDERLDEIWAEALKI